MENCDNNKEVPLFSGATILFGRWRMAAVPMLYPPCRLGAFIVLIGLLSLASPAHARRNRHVADSPSGSQNQSTGVDVGNPQAAPVPGAYNAGAPYGNQTQYRTGAVQPAYTPNINNNQGQPRPQYVANPYTPPVTNPYNAPNGTGMPAAPRAGIAPVPAPQGNPAQSGGSFSLADQYPAKPPRVSFRNGQLTIIADNSTLPDIMTAIHQRTGAALELPAALGNERVAVNLGPGATGDVLAELLNGSHFDYIVLNRPEDPSSPERIILREKVTADANAANNPYNNNGYNNGYGNMANPQSSAMYQPPPPPQEVPETVPDEEGPEEQPQPETAVSPAGDENQGNAKTPEQLLEELRQLQQQRGQPQQLPLQPQQPPLMDNNEPR